MNKFDDVKTLLFTNMDIKQSCEFLLNYLKNYCFKPYNKEKIDSYYNNFAEILKKLLYFPNEISINNPNSKFFQSFLQVLNAKNSNFEDFDTFLNLFLVPSNLDNEINIFSSIFIHNYGNTKFLFPITNSANSNKMILNYLNQNKSSLIFNTFRIFQILSQSKDDLIRYLAKKELILTTREYYIFIMLNFMKKASNVIKLNIKDYYPNYKRYFENISGSKFYSKKTEFIINNFEKDRSIIYNFYNILFLDFILYLHFTNNLQNQRLLEILTLAIEFLWLGDYLLIPQDDFYLNSYVNQNANRFNNQNLGDSSATNYNFPNNLPNNYYDNNFRNNYGITNPNINNSLNVSIPNLQILNGLKNMISLLQSKRYLFDEVIINGEKVSVLKPNILLFNLQNSLFNLFKNGFALYSKSENINTEISLSDFASVWYTFITPWESPFNNTEADIFYNSNNNEKNFGFFSWNFGNGTNCKNPIFHNNFRKNSSPLKNIFNAQSSNFKYKALLIDYLPYIETNIHFYTDLFQDYLNAYSSCNILSIEELSILINSLEIFELSPNGFFINDFINYFMLKDFSNGNINVSFFYLFNLQNLY